MTSEQYRALEDLMRVKWPQTIDPQFRSKRSATVRAPRSPQRTDLQKQIITHLKSPKTINELIRLTGSGRETVRYNLKVLQRENTVKVKGAGTVTDPQIWSKVAG